MKELAVQIIRCVDDEHFPGWIECEFTDAESRRHTVIDKIPIFNMDPTLDPLDRNTKYPQPGGVACEILRAWRDDQGRDLVHITTGRPWGVESSEKLSDFVVFATQLSEVPTRRTATSEELS
jgi:hypothetical protein